jgi:hypothetical protein
MIRRKECFFFANINSRKLVELSLVIRRKEEGGYNRKEMDLRMYESDERISD